MITIKRPEFDKFAEQYYSLHKTNIVLSGEEPAYFAEYKIRDLNKIIAGNATVPNNGRFLDFGAGVGSSIPFIRKYFPTAQLTSVDVSTGSLKIAAANFGGAAEYITFNGVQLPFIKNSFDVIYAMCVFHHIPPDEHENVLRELWRVLKPMGILMIYEHNPLNPFTVHTVKSCPFDQDAILINSATMKDRLKSAGFFITSVNYRVFFPRFLSAFRWMENWLKWFPLGAQYYILASKL